MLKSARVTKGFCSNARLLLHYRCNAAALHADPTRHRRCCDTVKMAITEVPIKASEFFTPSCTGEGQPQSSCRRIRSTGNEQHANSLASQSESSGMPKSWRQWW
jgi:hypothetical protein